ncbi:mannonate dehydratase [Catalinimonas alkaloidigena]|uniref:enolase C-terminal domain-like protein n=1 Tax=Catalinimonas alkaloidigena TaxID=1075417 RepID=UPI00240629A1|nr:enolase C-terminal domain-like protein [Catalinimonas alkaloidigena]MDF9798879.1 mannonate dehydratase [Catalinimonas alkaloidigena]
MDRRNVIKNLGLGLASGTIGALGLTEKAMAQGFEAAKYQKATNGLPPIKITNVKAISTRPSGSGSNLVVVKVETSEPGLYGLGCATFTQRAHAVITAVDKYLNDFCTGKSADNIEDMWQSTYHSSYWRNGPVLNNALSGLDQALWDIKGKRANMPVYELLGGKVRIAPPTYTHASGNSPEEVADKVQEYMDLGYKHVRIQMGGYSGVSDLEPDFKKVGFGHETDNFMDQYAYLKGVPKMFEAVRKACGERVELCHDVHERIQPNDAINLCKELEQYRPFFIEDPFSPENIAYFEQLRGQSSVPLAMGELFNSPHEWVEPMSKRWYDFIRIHISQIGGITPAMKVARLGEWFNVKTAWHGPGDTSPVGHAANTHISLAVWNFGILEMHRTVSDEIQEVFPGAPYSGDGYAHINEAPGLGVDINEDAAAKWPIAESFPGFGRVRKFDGTPIRP